VAGPALVAAVLFATGENFSAAFSSLFVPYLLLVFMLLVAYTKLKPRVSLPVDVKTGIGFRDLPREFLKYSAAVMFNAMGLVSIGLILYRISPSVLPWVVSLIYLAVQAVDAVAAPVAGYVYDSVGRRLLYLPFVLSIAPSTLIFLGGADYAIASALLFGVIYGMHESIYRAAVADTTPMEARGSAYGVFHTMYGFGFLMGGAAFGYLLENGLTHLAIPYAFATQALAIFLLNEAIKKP
jgi:MFS family permease